MKIFLDTANLEDIKKYSNMLSIDGVTTNPALISKEGSKNVKEVIEEICDIVNGPISAEVISTNSEGMIKEARELSKLHPNIVVKIPAIPEGFKALKILSNEGIKINFTVLYTANQAFLAAKCGATYVSPFIGRLDVNSTDGPKLIDEIAQIYNNHGFKTQIIAASMRNAIYVKKAALAGAHIATIPPEVLEDMMNSELSKAALNGFLNEWDKINPGKTLLGDDVE